MGWDLPIELSSDDGAGESLVPVGLAPWAPYVDAWATEVDVECLAGARVTPTPSVALRRPA